MNNFVTAIIFVVSVLIPAVATAQTILKCTGVSDHTFNSSRGYHTVMSSNVKTDTEISYNEKYEWLKISSWVNFEIPEFSSANSGYGTVNLRFGAERIEGSFRHRSGGMSVRFTLTNNSQLFVQREQNGHVRNFKGSCVKVTKSPSEEVTKFWSGVKDYKGSKDNSGLPHGKGTITWADGAVYSGDFVNGHQSGEGVETFISGSKFEGIYNNSKRVRGTFTWKDGTKFVGEFLQGKPDNGFVFDASGKKISKFVDGQKIDIQAQSQSTTPQNNSSNDLAEREAKAKEIAHAKARAARETRNAASQNKIDLPQVGTPYKQVRSDLIKMGWSPILHSDDDPDFATKFMRDNGFPEALQCAGTGSAPCVFLFKDKTGNLQEVLTNGELPKFSGIRPAAQEQNLTSDMRHIKYENSNPQNDKNWNFMLGICQNIIPDTKIEKCEIESVRNTKFKTNTAQPVLAYNIFEPGTQILYVIPTTQFKNEQLRNGNVFNEKDNITRFKVSYEKGNEPNSVLVTGLYSGNCEQKALYVKNGSRITKQVLSFDNVRCSEAQRVALSSSIKDGAKEIEIVERNKSVAIDSIPQGPQSQPATNDSIQKLNGSWYSPEWKYGYTLSDGVGTATSTNSPNFQVGQKIIQLTPIGPNKFSGQQIYKDGKFYKVTATLQPDGSLHFEGDKNAKWKMSRVR